MSAFPSWGGAQPPPSYPPVYGMQTGNTAQISTAYTPVQVRRSLEPSRPIQMANSLPNAAAAQTSPSKDSQATPSPAKDRFPPACRDWVARAYVYQAHDVSRDEFETKLKEIIRTATAQAQLWSYDWDNMDPPQVIIQKERAAANPTPTWTQTLPSLGPAINGNGTSSVGITSKKRKSVDTDKDNEDQSKASPPWVNVKNRNALEDRLSYPAQQQSRQQRFQEDPSPKGTSKFQKNIEKRQRKFDGGYKSTYKTPSPEPVAGPVVGRCQTLEKKYFRLTSAPDPDKVRPLHILEKALEVLKQKWRREGNYSYICDQFKSMRQDLTVQRIKNEFTVSVYEIHARIALEKGDLGEYNQCQTQLRALYVQNIVGKDVEFKAYRILYFIHTCNRTALNDVLADLTTAEKREPAIKHALDVRSALALGNYHRFFRLYLDTPNMGAYLMDMFVTRERLAALSNMCKAYKPQVKLRFITEELGFEGDSEAYHFIMEYSPDLLEERSTGDENMIYFLTGKAGTIFETAKAEAFRKVDLKGQI